jgi:phosphate transport system substrate-binding protein
VKITFKNIALMIFILSGTTASVQAAVEVKGAGGVSEKPLAQAWASQYSDAKLKYDNKNTSDAINEFLNKGSDFALIDSLLTTFQIPKAIYHHSLYLPAALSAQAVIYNLPGIPSGALKLTPAILSDIFLGRIRKWDDPVLRQLNPRLLLPSIDIRVVHQSDESSLNDFFPSFLEHQNPKWILKREKDKNLHWPVGQNVNGSLKVLQKIRQWAGVITVMNYSFAQEKKLPVAQIQNKSGRFVEPSAESIQAAASDLGGLSGDAAIALTESSVKKAYPLSNIVWAVVDQDYAQVNHKHNKGQALVSFLNWVLSTDGQNIASKIFYIPMPQELLTQAQAEVQSIQY